MKRCKTKYLTAIVFLSAIFCISIAMRTTVNATEQNRSENPIEAIMSDGVVVGINLNGNSVVISESKASSEYINIYYDDNNNGKVDGTESAVELSLDERGQTTDIVASVPIYGLYNNATSNTPFIITVESGQLTSLYGVHKATLNNTLKIDIKGGTFSDSLFGVYQGIVNVEDNQTAVDIDVTGKAVVKGYFTGIEGIYDNTTTLSTISGNVDIDWNTSDVATDDNGMTTFWGVKNNILVDGNVDIYINRIRAEVVYGLQHNVKVTGNFNQKSEFSSEMFYGNYGMVDSTVGGNADITIHGTADEEDKYSYVRAIQGYCAGEDNVAVSGNTKVVYSGGYVGNLYAISGARFLGDVVVDVVSANADDMILVENTNINGCATIDVREDCKVFGIYDVFRGGSVGKDVVMDLHNAYTKEESSSDNCHVLNGVSVTGDATISMDGGRYSDVRPIYGTSTQMAYIGGKLDMTIKNVKCYETTMVMYGAIMQDVNLTLENSEMSQFFGISETVAQGKVKMNISDSIIGTDTGNNSYLLFDSQYLKDAEVDISNTVTGSSCGFGVCFANKAGSGDIYLNFRNVEFDNGNYGTAKMDLLEGQELHCRVYVDAKVGVASTVENPLTNVAGIGRMLLESSKGKIQSTTLLPEGLKMEDGKIYGTPTKAYVDGKDITFTVADEYHSTTMDVHFVVAKGDCDFETAWSSDDKYHWHACTDKGCEEVKNKAIHTWDAGVVTKEATTAEVGIKTYTCTVCKATKAEEIPVKETTQEDNTEDTTEDATEDSTEDTTEDTTGDSTEENEDVVPAAKGTVLDVDDKNGAYTVTNASETSPEVSYKIVNKKAKEVVIPKTITVDDVTYKVTSIQNGAFKNHKNLKKVTIGANVKTIGQSAFSGCKQLTTVKMGKNVQAIGEKAFYNCTALKKIEIPSKVNKIGAKAFYNCKKLTNITIKTIKLTTKNVGKQAFTKAGSSNYKKLTVKVPKKKLKAYKTMLKKCGLSSKAKVKK